MTAVILKHTVALPKQLATTKKQKKHYTLVAKGPKKELWVFTPVSIVFIVWAGVGSD